MVTALVENGARISLTSSPPTSASGDSFKSETPLELVKRLLAAEPQPTATANGSSTAGKKGNAAEQRCVGRGASGNCVWNQESLLLCLVRDLQT